ncbi:hypothetical protein XCR_4257 [Xanthomonas campestris pv. raphani 756C]|nr:hypothetical protein XCR_4257 [Xanthomonas campestris pv. raphani 756C]
MRPLSAARPGRSARRGSARPGRRHPVPLSHTQVHWASLHACWPRRTAGWPNPAGG